MENKRLYRLFEVYGLELEYMIVDRRSLEIRPIADLLMRDKAGEMTADVENGDITWSNELVAHLVELKVSQPVPRLDNVEASFLENVREMNTLLQRHDAMLLSTASHPLMDPKIETRLWEHDYKEIYALYHRIFDCRGHGWANLQSAHLNLPFAGDDEFGRLHAAIRLLLPMLPALCASSPLREGRTTGYADSRMEAYLHHQEKIPSLMGRLIPEAIFTEQDYQKQVFDRMMRDIQPYDVDQVMEQYFLNSRGAIARFDRGAIEIRVLDLQECPLADAAISALISVALQSVVGEKWIDLPTVMQWDEETLLGLFRETIRNAEQTIISNQDYLRMFGIKDSLLTGKQFWEYIFTVCGAGLSPAHRGAIRKIIGQGPLATRILRALNDDLNREAIIKVYRVIGDCLVNNRIFEA